MFREMKVLELDQTLIRKKTQQHPADEECALSVFPELIHQVENPDVLIYLVVSWVTSV